MRETRIIKGKEKNITDIEQEKKKSIEKERQD